MRKTLSLLALTAALALPVQAVDINVDLNNLGPATAHDVAIVLQGFEMIDGTYDGWFPFFADHHFRTFSKSFDGLNTTLHWEHPYDETLVPPAPAPIFPGNIIHVGYSTPDKTSTIIDMYWTDLFGNRIHGGEIAVVGGHIDVGGVTFHNTLKSRISISNLRYQFRNVPVRLEELTARNPNVMGALLPLPFPGAITLEPGQSVRVAFPHPALPGHAAIVVYDTIGPSANGAPAARSITFVQDVPLLQ